MLIERPPLLYRLLFPGAVWRINPHEKCVYLSFDDGPIPQTTPWLLDTLSEHGAQAAMFMVGDNAERYPSLLDQAIARGHIIGNHTMHHTQGIKTGLKRYVDDVVAAQHVLHSGMFRPPHGLMGPGQIGAVRRLGLQVVMHDVVTRDYDPSLSAETILSNVQRWTRPGSIIVFHDSLKAWPGLRQALPQALRWLKEQGYEFGHWPSEWRAPQNSL